MSKTIFQLNNRFRIKYWELNSGERLQLILDRDYTDGNDFNIWWQLWSFDGRFGVEVLAREWVKDYIKEIKN